VGQIYAVSPFLGERPLMMAFIVVILGGMGSIPGAALGGVILGFTESFVGTSTALPHRPSVVWRRDPACSSCGRGASSALRKRDMTRRKRNYGSSSLLSSCSAGRGSPTTSSSTTWAC